MNKPVAWMTETDGVAYFSIMPVKRDAIPLYTHPLNPKYDPETGEPLIDGYPLFSGLPHPVKGQKCVVKDCKNHQHEGGFNGDVCSPCYQFIVHGKGIHSQAYRNAKPAELTDAEIRTIQDMCHLKNVGYNTFIMRFARAILRKASEK